ncbi:MAG: hypothetical protein ACE368_12905 [Paracoccaceae bacterium]
MAQDGVPSGGGAPWRLAVQVAAPMGGARGALLAAVALDRTDRSGMARGDGAHLPRPETVTRE